MALSKRGAIIIISLVLFESVCLGERDLSCLEEGLSTFQGEFLKEAQVVSTGSNLCPFLLG
jgi:hypothetical protein